MDASERRTIAAKGLCVCNCEGKFIWSWDSWRVFQDREDRGLVIKALVKAITEKIGEDGIRKANWVVSASASDGLAFAAPLAVEMSKTLGLYQPARGKWIGRKPNFRSEYVIAADFVINAGGHLDSLVRALSKEGAGERLLAYAVLFDCVKNEVRSRNVARVAGIEDKIVSLITPDDFPDISIMFPDGREDLKFVGKRVFLEEEFQHIGFRDTSHTTRCEQALPSRVFSVEEWKQFIATT